MQKVGQVEKTYSKKRILLEKKTFNFNLKKKRLFIM